MNVHTSVSEHTSVQDAITTLNITGDLNLGMIVRSASLFGISHFHTLHKYDNEKEKIIKLLTEFSNMYTLIFLEQHPHSVPLVDFRRRVPQNKPVMFIVGNEGVGIPRDILNHIPGIIVEIPQKGHNVSNSLSILLWEYYRTDFIVEDSIV